MTAIDWTNPVPQAVTDLDIAFGGNEVVRRLMPPMDQIPKDARRSWAARLFSDLFFFGGSVAHLVPKPGCRVTSAHLWALTQKSEPPLDPGPRPERVVVVLFAVWVLLVALGLGMLLSGCSQSEMEARKPVQRKAPRRPAREAQPKMESQPRYPTCTGPDFGGDRRGGPWTICASSGGCW